MTKVSANEFNWEKSDIFVVPSWQWHSHENTTSEDAILFSITDQPAREALGLYREEAEGQDVLGREMDDRLDGHEPRSCILDLRFRSLHFIA